jgi:hypothetical protein
MYAPPWERARERGNLSFLRMVESAGEIYLLLKQNVEEMEPEGEVLSAPLNTDKS